jgi:hypothetical protein
MSAADRPPRPIDHQVEAAIARVVGGASGRGVTLTELWRAAVTTDAELGSAVDRRARLAAVLERLQAAGRVRLPARRAGYDHSGVPPLPQRVWPVRLPAPAPAPRRSTLPADLLPELASAAKLTLRVDEVDTLRRVNRFLRDWDPARPWLPSRERSLEVFDSETRLDELAATRLFQLGVLSHDRLRCFPVHPPFVHARVGATGVVLAVENHDTYASALRALRLNDRGIGVVAYGAGKAFCASVTYVAELDPPATAVWYFGDLDGEGLRIPALADQVARHARLPPVRPAAGLYGRLLERNRRRAAKRTYPPEEAVALAAWLPGPHQATASALLVDGHRLPQEAVTFEELAKPDLWLE